VRQRLAAEQESDRAAHSADALAPARAIRDQSAGRERDVDGSRRDTDTPGARRAESSRSD
jgi:hypothetical protein